MYRQDCRHIRAYSPGDHLLCTSKFKDDSRLSSTVRRRNALLFVGERQAQRNLDARQRTFRPLGTDDNALADVDRVLLTTQPKRLLCGRRHGHHSPTEHPDRTNHGERVCRKDSGE